MARAENIVLTLFLFLPFLIYAQDDPVLVATDSLLNTKSYTYSNPQEKYTLEIYLNDLNKGILRYRYQGKTALPEQIRILKILLKKVLRENTSSFHTLSWGRLSNGQNKDYTLAERLALAASKASDWDSKTGKPVKGNINTFIKDLASRENIYPELKDLFRSFDYTITFASAEKVLVMAAEKLPFWESISSKVDKKAKLPFDCQTWFELKRAAK